MMKQPVISVIVPVYRVEQCLSRCIESLLVQSFVDFELLLIDDGSPDASGAICDDWAKRDDRIRVFHQENSGVSAARNKGLREAVGRYIVFVDSDDYVEVNYLLHLYEKRTTTADSIVVQGFVNLLDTGAIKQKKCLTPAIYIGEKIGDLFLNDEIREMRGPISKLYLRSIIEENKLRFPLGISFGEDTIFIFNYLLYCNQVVVGDSVDYMYCDTANSLTKRLNDFESEYATFRQYYTVLVRLAQKLEMDITEMNTSFSFTILFFKRSLISSYRSNKKTSFSLRTKYLRRLSIENKDFLWKYYNPSYKADRFGKFLLIHGCFFCYNLYISLLYYSRFKWIFGAP